MKAEREKKGQEKEAGKRGRKKAVILLAGMITAAGIYGIWQIQASADTAAVSVTAAASAGEEILYGQITAVRGNEITYVTARESGSAGEGEETEELRQPDTGGRETVSGGDAMFPTDMEAMPAEGLSDGKKGSESGMPDPSDPELSATQAAASQGFTYDNKLFQLTEEESTELIPVGTPVTTKLGTVTTFSRLAAGDNIAIVRSRATGEITAVYILG